MRIQFGEIPEFHKDLKALRKRFFSLEDDIEVLKKVLTLYPQGNPPSIVRISYKEISNIKCEIYKVKHFRCRSLRGRGSRSGIRIIYAFDVERQKIIFVEIYFKEREDSDCDLERILDYFN